jgi:PTH1 family peptidyl-tRNA hydrolase
MIRLATFLGNPGKEYAGTRHNAAWLMKDFLSFTPALSWQEKFSGRYAAARTATGTLYVVEPQTYMNLSGQCVQKFLSFFKISPGEILAVHDELELSFGTVGFRFGGGLGGHNGLRSLAGSLGTGDFYRFRIGIGRPNRGDAASYVLSRFSPEEEPLLGDYLGRAAEILEECLNSSNKRSLSLYKKVKIIETITL